MPPAGPFLVPARKGRKNRPGKSRPVDGEIFSSFAKLCFGNDIHGYPTIVCLILLLGGLQLFTTGILGQYLAKTYLECKKRPIYLVQETENDLKKTESEN